MHGVKRSDFKREKTSDELSKLSERKRIYSEILMKIRTARRNEIYTTNVRNLTKQILRLDPDYPDIWHYRKEILTHLYEKNKEVSEKIGSSEISVEDINISNVKDEALDPKSENLQHSALEDAKQLVEEQILPRELVQQELAFNQEALKLNPKSGVTWYHRSWLISNFTRDCDLKRELALISKLLELDERNYHCWNYRREIVNISGVSKHKELDYSTEKIDQNFSNYSAYHLRSNSLEKDNEEVLQGEIEMIQQAVFTEPDDQSSWFYFKWILANLISINIKKEEDLVNFLRSQIVWLEELNTIEENCKWALVMIAHVNEELLKIPGQSTVEISTNCYNIYESLKDIDPQHYNFYQDKQLLLTKS